MPAPPSSACARRSGPRWRWRAACRTSSSSMTWRPRARGALSKSFQQIVADEQRPTLVVKGGFSVGGVAAVAWDGGKEASRALRTALPLLRKASSVIVLTAPAATQRKIDPDQLVSSFSQPGACAARSRCWAIPAIPRPPCSGARRTPGPTFWSPARSATRDFGSSSSAAPPAPFSEPRDRPSSSPTDFYKEKAMPLSRIVMRLARNPGTEFAGGDDHRGYTLVAPSTPRASWTPRPSRETSPLARSTASRRTKTRSTASWAAARRNGSSTMATRTISPTSRSIALATTFRGGRIRHRHRRGRPAADLQGTELTAA